MLKKKVSFLLLFFLFFLPAFISSQEQTQSTQTLLSEQKEVLTKSKTLIINTKSNQQNLLKLQNHSLQEIENLKENLNQSKQELAQALAKLNQSEKQLEQANQKIQVLEKDSTNLKNSLNSALVSTNESQAAYKKLQGENLIIKIAGGAAIAILAGLLIAK